MDRRAILLDGLKLDGLGLEIGGGYHPVAAGWPGLDVRTLDHLATDELIAKYGTMGQDTANILPVDYVWSGEPYRDLVGETRFDWIVASHVVEHVPDLVGFINQCADILTDDGILALAVPDRRYTFDFFRAETGLGELIDAHLQERTVSSPGAVAQHFLHLSELDGQGSWGGDDGGAPTLTIPSEVAAAEFERARGGGYIDVHAWAFTPSSFRLAIDSLSMLGLLHVQEVAFHPSLGCEFFVHLSKAGAGCGISRQRLSEQAMEDRRGPFQQPPPGAGLLAQEVLRLQARIASLLGSTSWKATAPLRAVGAAIKGRPAGH